MLLVHSRSVVFSPSCFKCNRFFSALYKSNHDRHGDKMHVLSSLTLVSCHRKSAIAMRHWEMKFIGDAVSPADLNHQERIPHLTIYPAFILHLDERLNRVLPRYTSTPRMILISTHYTLNHKFYNVTSLNFLLVGRG